MISYKCNITDENMKEICSSLSLFGLVCLLDTVKAEFCKRGFNILVISDKAKPIFFNDGVKDEK